MVKKRRGWHGYDLIAGCGIRLDGTKSQQMSINSTRSTQFAKALSMVLENAGSHQCGEVRVDHAQDRVIVGGARLAFHEGFRLSTSFIGSPQHRQHTT